MASLTVAIKPCLNMPPLVHIHLFKHDLCQFALWWYWLVAFFIHVKTVWVTEISGIREHGIYVKGKNDQFRKGLWNLRRTRTIHSPNKGWKEGFLHDIDEWLHALQLKRKRRKGLDAWNSVSIHTLSRSPNVHQKTVGHSQN